MEERIALFDLDGVAADYDSQIKKDLREFSDEPLPEVLHGNLTGKLAKVKDLIRCQQGWWENLPVIESGTSLMKLCADIGYGIHILTQVPKDSPNGWTEKFNWCERNVKPIYEDYGISMTRGGKGLTYGTVFFDDYPVFMSEWLDHRPRGQGFMPNLPSNREYSHPQVLKYDPKIDLGHSPELEEKLRLAFEREPGKE